MKKIIYMIILLGIFIIIPNKLVYASSENGIKIYSIDNANFDVYLDEDGNAEVHEKWTVNFRIGNFTRFYVSRLKDINSLENFSDIEFESFKVDGNSMIKTDNKDQRPEGTYYVDDRNYEVEYQWNIKSKNKMIFETTYKLKDVVKLNDDDKALFCYRFVGAEFVKKINKINISIHSPKKCDIEVKDSWNTEYKIYDDRVDFSTKNNKGLLKIYLSMDKNVFGSGIEHISKYYLDNLDKNDKEEKRIDAKNNRITFVFILVVSWVICTGIIVVIIKITNYTKTTKLSRNKSYICSVINELKCSNITPFEFSRIIGVKRKSINEFKLIFLELVRRNVLLIRRDYIYLNNSSLNLLKSFERTFINYLDNYIKRDQAGLLFISMDDIMKVMQDSNALNGIVKIFDDNEARLYSKNMQKKLKKQMEILMMFFKSEYSRFTNSMPDIIDRYIQVNYIDIENLYYMAGQISYTTLNEVDYSDSSLGKYYHSYPLIYMDYHSQGNSSEGSGCGGCSSCGGCSGCSGCGGGGAD